MLKVLIVASVSALTHLVTCVPVPGGGGGDAYAALSGCGTTNQVAAQPPTQSDTTCVTRGGCPSGMEITTCTVDDGGHCWFGNDTCGTGVPGGQLFVGNNAEGIVAATAVWGFLSRFDCASCGL